MTDVTYDKDGDVLYVAWEKVAAERGTVTEDGMVKRYDHAGNLIGVTFVDFAAWLKDYIDDADLTKRMDKRANDAVR